MAYYYSDSDECFDNKFIGLDNIVQYLFDNGLLTDIECRKIVMTDNIADLAEVRAAIYSIICTKNSTTFKEILKVFRNDVHPLQSPKILGRIFSFLKFGDIANCGSVCEDWKAIFQLLIKSKYNKINMDQLLMDTLIRKQNFIINPESDFGKIAAMQATVFTLCLAIKPDRDDTLHQLLQKKSEFQENVNDRSADESYTVEDPTMNLIPKVLSVDLVLNTMFQFLSLQDIKSCRIVCRKWNSVAESFLRKLSVVLFRPSIGHSNISSFSSISKYTSSPHKPFTVFKFIGDFPTCELTDFFSKLGENVKTLHLSIIEGIRPCLLQTSNLTELNVQGTMIKFHYKMKTDVDMMIPFNKLQSIKVLRLTNTLVKVDSEPEKEYTRIVPLKITMHNVRFFIDGTYPPKITLNTFVDFSQVKDVNITRCSRQVQIFDWASETFEADIMSFKNVQQINAAKSKSAVDHLKLACWTPLPEKANMSVKQILIEEGWCAKLSALPQSLQKLGINVTLRFSYLNARINPTDEKCQLPNLKYLSLYMNSGYSLSFLSLFEKCYNLTDLEIAMEDAVEIDISWLPRSVKRLKLDSPVGDISFVDDGTRESFELDLLILNYINFFHLEYLNIEKLRPKVLVVQLDDGFDDNAIVSFLQRNKRTEKIFLNCMKPYNFYETEFSGLVGRSSNFYEFSNGRGNDITYWEYTQEFNKFIDVKIAMKEFWNSDGEEYHEVHKGRESRSYLSQDDSDDADSDASFVDGE